MRIFLIFVSFFLLGAFFIISNNDLALSSSDNLSLFGTLYKEWVAGLFDNSRQITGYVVQSKWLPNVTQ